MEEIDELEQLPDTPAGWQAVGTGELFSDMWERLDDAGRGAELREWGITATVSRPAVKRARVPIGDRVRMHFGDLEDAADEMAGLAHSMQLD